MPYFVYRVRPLAQLEKLAEFAAFREASALAKSERARMAGEPTATVRVMFAASEQIAEDLLCQIRDPDPGGEDA